MQSLQTPAVATTSIPAASQSLSITLLALAAFLIVTTEYLIVGVLPDLSRDLSISISTAGQLVGLFAFTVMLAGPPLTAWLSHVDRKHLFVTILLVFAVSNAMAALAPNIIILGVARFIPALALPVFWGTASETAGQIAGPRRAAQAVSRVYLGISGALLFGIPLGTLAANGLGWRGAFWILAAASLLMAAALATFMPTVQRTARVRLAEQALLFRKPSFLANLVLSVIAFTAMFTAYTYLADTFERIAGVPPADVGWWLMGFGAVGLIGNWLGGRTVDRSPLQATAIFLALLAVGMTLCALWAGNRMLFCGSLLIWGIAYTALFPICQVRVMRSAPGAQALAGTANVSAANAGIGFGAAIGGIVIPTWGLGSIGYVASAVALLGLVMIPLVGRAERAVRN